MPKLSLDSYNLPPTVRAAIQQCRKALADLDLESQRAAIGVILADFFLLEKAASREGETDRLH
jgi:hypothetical protein